MSKIDLISTSFKVIEAITQKQFVTLRGFDEIPDKVSVNNDIDVMVCGSHIIPSLESNFTKLGFTMMVDNHTYLYGAEPHYQFVNYGADVKFDIVTGLYYRSTSDPMIWIPINSEVQKSMMVNKISVDKMWMKQPSPEDELIHILCHCIFDKREVSKKYVNRIGELLDVVDDDTVKTLMERAFYLSWEKVFDTMKSNPLKLYKEYITYVDY